MGENKIALRYGTLDMFNKNPSVKVVVTDGLDAHKVCKRFNVELGDDSYGTFWGISKCDVFGGEPTIVIYVDSMLPRSAQIGNIAHEAFHAATWYYQNVATNKLKRRDEREEQIAQWVGFIADISYELLYGKR